MQEISLESFSGFLIAAGVSKSSSESRLWSWKLVNPEKKSSKECEGKQEQKSDAASEQFLELVNVFKEASRNLIFIFSLNKAG